MTPAERLRRAVDSIPEGLPQPVVATFPGRVRFTWLDAKERALMVSAYYPTEPRDGWEGVVSVDGATGDPSIKEAAGRLLLALAEEDE